MSRHIETRDVGKVTIVKVPCGSLSRLSEPWLVSIRDQVTNLLSLGKLYLVLDLSQVGHVGSAGKGALITIRRRVFQAGGNLVLCGLDESLLESFEVTKLDKLFAITQDEAEAIDECARLVVNAPIFVIRT